MTLRRYDDCTEAFEMKGVTTGERGVKYCRRDVIVDVTLFLDDPLFDYFMSRIGMPHQEPSGRKYFSTRLTNVKFILMFCRHVIPEFNGCEGFVAWPTKFTLRNVVDLIHVILQSRRVRERFRADFANDLF